MVASGLSVRTDVSQYRLTAHLGVGVLLLGAVLWMAFSLLPMKEAGAASLARGVRWRALALAGVIFLQILAGGFTAGTDAGLSHNTWPLIDGALFPGGLWTMQPWHLNLFENVLTIQFNHRMLGYLAGVLAMVHAASVWRRLGAGPARTSAGLLAACVLVQIALGVAVLLSVVQIGAALAHQAVAVTLFALALYHLHTVRGMSAR
jgi:heme a synthase